MIYISAVSPQELIPVVGIMHIQSTVSDGIYSINEIARMSLQKGIDVVFLTDHDFKVWEYGFPPFRKIIKKRIESDSVLKFGAGRYLSLIRKAEKSNSPVIIIPGVEAAPFYYWSGSIWKQNIELRAWHRHILVIGLYNPEDYENMPLVANGKSSFDQYHGDKWYKPYQELIDYVRKKGGMTFWAHPEAENRQMIKGILIHTLPYPDFLPKTYNYNGFGIFHEGYREVGRPGGLWDKILMEYVSHKRSNGIVAIGEIDYERGGIEVIDEVKNIFFVKEKSREAIWESLKDGCFYVVKKSSRCDLRLDRFEIFSGETRAIMGEKISIQNTPLVTADISDAGGNKWKVLVKLIRNGRIVDIREGVLPLKYVFADKDTGGYREGYYRLDIFCEGSHLISNPIFFKKWKAE